MKTLHAHTTHTHTTHHTPHRTHIALQASTRHVALHKLNKRADVALLLLDDRHVVANAVQTLEEQRRSAALDNALRCVVMWRTWKDKNQGLRILIRRTTRRQKQKERELKKKSRSIIYSHLRHDGNAVAQQIGLIHEVRGEQDGAARLVLQQQVPCRTPRSRVHSCDVEGRGAGGKRMRAKLLCEKECGED